MGFFLSADYTLGTKLVECVYILIGIIAIYAGVKNFRDEGNPSRLGTGIFWTSLGVVIAFGRWLPSIVSGILVVVMVVPAIMQKVKPGTQDAPSKELTEERFKKIGLKIFLPALAMGVFSLLFAKFLPAFGSYVGIGFGVLLAMVLTMIYEPSNKPATFFKDSERLLSLVGPLSLLPILLGALGTVFTTAGVGDVISSIVSAVVPAGNVNLGIIVYAVGMMLFTMIMGNAFAAITVMTIGIGGPLVLSYGADPVVIGMLALTCGYCGTLCTPMAANFNIVPVAILDMKDRFGVIKHQVLIALIMLVFQICYMIAFK